MTFLFVGERPSDRALALGATLRGGGLSATTLHSALRAAGVDPAAQHFCNLLKCETGEVSLWALWRIRGHADAGLVVVGLGRKVVRILTRAGIPHIPLRHPGCRGAARRTADYQAHVRYTLGLTLA